MYILTRDKSARQVGERNASRSLRDLPWARTSVSLRTFLNWTSILSGWPECCAAVLTEILLLMHKLTSISVYESMTVTCSHVNFPCSRCIRNSYSTDCWTAETGSSSPTEVAIRIILTYYPHFNYQDTSKYTLLRMNPLVLTAKLFYLFMYLFITKNT